MTQLTERVAQSLWRLSPAGMAERLSRGQWRRARHLEYLNEKITGLATAPLRFLVSIPPRHGKSELFSHWLPVWFLSTWPTKRVILVSYEADFAASWGRKARDTVEEHSEVLGVKLREDVKGSREWELESGGGMVAAGVGGPITGRGGDLILVDDPTKNWEEAQSITYREMLRSWWGSTLRSRLEPGGSIVVVMARWHREDLIGWLAGEGSEGWEALSLPALAGREDVLGRREGEALWPERYDLDALRVAEREVGQEAWLSLYQQAPESVAGDCYFEVEVLARLRKEAQNTEVLRPYIAGRRYAAAIDPAGLGKDNHSLSILDCQTGGFVVDYTTREAPGDFALKAYRLLSEYQYPLLAVESNGVGLNMITVLEGLGWPREKLVFQDEERTKPGVVMTGNLRDRILVDLAEGVRQGSLVVCSKKAVEEMFSFVKRDKASPRAATGAHDDRVMAMAGANWCAKKLPASVRPVQRSFNYARA